MGAFSCGYIWELQADDAAGADVEAGGSGGEDAAALKVVDGGVGAVNGDFVDGFFFIAGNYGFGVDGPFFGGIDAVEAVYA